jgi:hypothetical protein
MNPRLLVAVAALTAATACSASGSSSLGPSAGNRVSPATRFDSAGCPKSVVYVVSGSGISVKIYDRANLALGPCGSITGLQSPQGLFTDSKGSLWVADAAAQKIYKFAPGIQSPVATLSDPNGVPMGVAVDEKNGIVYVTEYENKNNPTTLVEIYANGTTTPTGSLSDPAARNGGFDAVDNQGNLYVTFMTQSNTAQVDRWMGGSGTPQNLGLHLVSDGGILTTASGALAVCDPFAFRCGEFLPGSTKMSHVFGHMGRGQSDLVPNKPPWLHPNAPALDRHERRAYVAADSLTTWSFPGPANRPNRLPLDEIKVPGGAGNGVAVTPASRPGAPY